MSDGYHAGSTEPGGAVGVSRPQESSALPFGGQNCRQTVCTGEHETQLAAGVGSPHDRRPDGLLRLEPIVRVALDQPVDGGAAYDEDGFVRALVAAGWSGEGGWRVQLHPNDHDPPHVHFRDKGDPKKEIRLSLATGEPLAGEAIPVGVKKKLARAGDFILENQDLLM